MGDDFRLGNGCFKSGFNIQKNFKLTKKNTSLSKRGILKVIFLIFRIKKYFAELKIIYTFAIQNEM